MTSLRNSERKRSRQDEGEADDDVGNAQTNIIRSLNLEVGAEVDDPESETDYDFDAEDPPEKPSHPAWKGDELAPLVKDLVNKKRWSKDDKARVVELMIGRPGFDLSRGNCATENINVCDAFIDRFNKLLDEDPNLLEVVDPVFIVFQRPAAGFPAEFPGHVPPFMVQLDGSQEVWRADGVSLERQYGNCRDFGVRIQERFGNINFWIFRSKPHERW